MKASEARDRASATSIRQLKLFESVGRLASVRRGSEECNLSQPAVTQALGKLEDELGLILLERRASGSYLTDAGKIFHHRIQRLFEQLEQAIVMLGVPGGSANAASIANRLSRSQIRCLLAIIDNGSFARAAEQLRLTQASLQRAARDLEGNLRKSIFYRTAAGVVVTPDGIEFGRLVRLAMQEAEWGLREIDAAHGNTASQITIGALPFGGNLLLASVLEEFLALQPDAEVRIINEGAIEMLRRLRAGEVDLAIGIVQDALASDLSFESFADTPFQVVARRGHPLTRKGKVELADLAGYEWVIGIEGSSRRSFFETLFDGRELPRAPVATSALPIIRQLLLTGDRLTVMTDFELDQGESGLSSLPVSTTAPVPSVGITQRSNWLPTQLHRDFIDLLRRRVDASTVAARLRKVG